MSPQEYVALCLGAAAAVQDVRARKISNWFTVGGLAAGLILAAHTGGCSGLWHAAEGAAAGFAVFFGMHLLGGLGGGDVKLMAAFGALLGAKGVLLAAVLAAGLGGLVAAAVAVIRPRAAAIPYAPAIVAAAWLSMLAQR
jgi:prepilin peptidase CpaA